MNQKLIEKFHSLEEILSWGFPHGTALHDRTGKILMVNGFFEELFKFNSGDILRDGIELLANGDSEILNEMMECDYEINKKHDKFEKKTIRYNINNEVIDCRVIGIPILVDDIFLGSIGIYIDIREELKRKKAASIKNRLQGIEELLGAIFHEFTQPMTVILGYAELLQYANKDGCKNTKCQYSIDEIKKSVDRMSDLLYKIENIKEYKAIQYTSDRRILKID